MEEEKIRNWKQREVSWHGEEKRRREREKTTAEKKRKIDDRKR